MRAVVGRPYPFRRRISLQSAPPSSQLMRSFGLLPFAPRNINFLATSQLTNSINKQPRDKAGFGACQAAQFQHGSLFAQICSHGDLTPLQPAHVLKRARKGEHCRVGAGRWKNPYFSNMQTGPFIRRSLTHVFEQSQKQQLGGKSFTELRLEVWLNKCHFWMLLQGG